MFPAAAAYAPASDSSTSRRPGPADKPGARSRRAVGGRQRARPGDDRREGAGLRGQGQRATLERLNLAPLLKNPAQRSDITGHGGHRSAAGERRRRRRRSSIGISGDVHVRGAGGHGRGLSGARTSARPAASPAAGSRSTPARRRTAAPRRRRASSRCPRPGRALAFDLRGSADGVDLREPAGAAARAEARDRPLGGRVPRRGTGPERQRHARC